MKISSTRSKSRRDDILNAALKCFTQHGIAATTIDMIRAESGASVGSVYHHFGSKEAIAAALYMLGMEDHFAQLKDALAECATAEEGVKSVVRVYIEWITQNPDWARYIFGSRGEALSEEQQQKLKQDNKRHFTYLKDWFTPYLENGQIRALPFDLYHSLLIGPAQDYARHWLASRVKKPPTHYIDIFCDSAWSSLTP
ncbi:TetR/AcrR family transcriptional regulator [Hahella sp. CR1]|uniref:TetR/AcrR family transcriptional regulator n=1 Tax=Hahella sp. CR1 TaxID=2992807 RepID=UPI0024436712|nr:TetR/AcrR family transcriptional regulator [Hahella sp. CR1]MDG9670790.1 TetR/AcrR family transcriptional regulator [Hahella sp. CR1]